MTMQQGRGTRPSDCVPSRRQGVESGTRAELLLAWLGELLSIFEGKDFGSSFEAAGQVFVDTLAKALPECAVGVCIALPQDQGGPLILRHLPMESPRDAQSGPSRLFADWAYELSVVVPGEPEGSTLHLAAMGPLPEEGLEAALLKRAAQLLAGALRSARAATEAEAQTRELARLKAQMAQSEKLAGLGQIAAGIVHELNNPLTSIIAYSDYLRRKAVAHAADESDIERFSRIIEAAERIRSFSHDLVAYARPSSEVSRPVAINGIIDRALLFCEHVLTKADIEVERRFTQRAIYIAGLSGQLTQVFVNLVTNASHAMASGGGHLLVTTEAADPGLVRVTISDNGHGIPGGHLPRLFDPFFTTKGDGRGTGLGLAIVHDIVTAHGGTIEVASEVGRGTRFVLSFPTTDHPSSRPSG